MPKAPRRVLVLHQAVAEDAPLDERDVLSAAASVSMALRAQGIAVDIHGVTPDLAETARLLREDTPDLVFNLVESLGGHGALAVAIPALLAALGIAHTGSPAAAIAVADDKLATKRVLRTAGIPTPPGLGQGWPGPWIVKHATEHASQGLHAGSVVTALPDPLPQGWFAEAFLPGREFNLSLLEQPDGAVRVLPPAELIYAEDWPADMPRILDYAGKWDTAHPLYSRTTRRFDTTDQELADRLTALARRCWQVLGLRGYARVDLRLDAAGTPHVLEVNANPCLSEDAGFAAAAAQAGIAYSELIGHIAAAALSAPPSHAARPAQAQRVPPCTLRRDLRPGDPDAIAALCAVTGFFTPAELAIARELPAEFLVKGQASGYHFLLAEDACGLAAYACYGQVPGTEAAWDLYWIVVHPSRQGAGIGRLLVDQVMAHVSAAGGTRLYAETSGRALYAPTRAFYSRAEFTLQASLPDFYAPGDAKLIWMRII